jgi:Peptidase A4 family
MSSNEQKPILSDEQQFLAKLSYKVTPTNLRGVYSNPTLPDDFDPQGATQDDFTHHGLMFRKPNAERTPEIHEIYQRFFSKQWLEKNRIIPESVPHIGITHNFKGKLPTKTSNTSWLENSWAGAGQNTKTYTGVVGNWTIPTVSQPIEPQGAEGGWHSSSWIGIDGMFTSSDVLQAGIDQRVDANGNASYFPWYEWYIQDDNKHDLPHYIYETSIPNFPVKPGDQIVCFCYYQGHTAGNIMMANNTNNSYIHITLAPPAAPGQPSPATFNGSSVEWIMEVPDGGENNSSLPKFTPVKFADCVACVSDGSTIKPSDCDTLNVINPQTNQVLTSVTTDENSVTINFIG